MTTRPPLQSEVKRPEKASKGIFTDTDIGEEDQKRLIDAERALAERPKLSISLRISLSMMLSFLLVAGVVAASMFLVSRVSLLQEFLDKVSTYALEVEQARRYEKNYFLYGTGLDEALIQVQAAHVQLRSTRSSLIEMLGPQDFEEMEDNLEGYSHLLEDLAMQNRLPTEEGKSQRATIERDLRRHGAQLVADATDLIGRERLRLRTSIHTSWIIAAVSLLFILLTMILATYILTRQVAKPLQRFAGYTERIANGDFSPILPARNYRDEFSRLAVAINRMLFRLKERESQLARSSRMAAVGTLTAGVAHELNNPLNNIGLNAEVLYTALNTYTDEQKLEMLGDIVRQVERASATVRNLLDFTRVEKPVMIALAIKDIVEKTRKLVANESDINGVEFCLELPDGLPKVQGNPRDLQQVFLNLFVNAIQAMPDGGFLTVRGQVKSDEIVGVDIVDTGVGIPEAQLESIFDPFFTTKEVGVGSGLGLFVCLGIIKKHNGTITVRSKEGEGTTFTVNLQIANAVNDSAQSATGSEAHSNSSMEV